MHAKIWWEPFDRDEYEEVDNIEFGDYGLTILLSDGKKDLRPWHTIASIEYGGSDA